MTADNLDDLAPAFIYLQDLAHLGCGRWKIAREAKRLGLEPGRPWSKIPPSEIRLLHAAVYREFPREPPMSAEEVDARIEELGL